MILNFSKSVLYMTYLLMILTWGCSDLEEKYTGTVSLTEQLQWIENAINTHHIAYDSYANKKVVKQAYTFSKSTFNLDDVYSEIYRDLYLIDQSNSAYTPFLYDLHIDTITSESIIISSDLYLGSSMDKVDLLSPIDPCEPFDHDYYIGWEVSLLGPQEQNPYNSRCDGEDKGNSAFQKISHYMASGMELQQPPINKGNFVFTEVAYFDLRFENNQFSNHDYQHLVENCIGRPVNEFKPDVCVPNYDLNCLYCELMPLIEAEVETQVLPPNAEIAIFYFFFGYNSTGLDNNSIGYGLCYGVPDYIAPTDFDYSDERCFCSPVPDRPLSSL